MKRRISHTEIQMAYDCNAKWDFSYGGHLTGGHTLQKKNPAIKLREGRAWGRAVAALHGAVDSKTPTLPGLSGDNPVPGSSGDGLAGGPLTSSPGDIAESLSPASPLGGRLAVSSALHALVEALDEDAEQQMELDLYVAAEYWDLREKMVAILHHYNDSTEPLRCFSPELELVVPLPSRTGQRRSNRFEFHGFLDALSEDIPGYEGKLFVVEYKLRDSITDYAEVRRARQPRRYVWAAEQQLGREIAGFVLDERLNAAPKPVRWVKPKRKAAALTADGLTISHAKDQMCTAERYAAACNDYGVPMVPETYESLKARDWQKRHVVPLTRAEIEEAGQELVEGGKLIAQLDAGHLHPVRNEGWRCPSCFFRPICDSPNDPFVAMDYERGVPKRLREELPEAA